MAEIERARALRQKATWAERWMWTWLRGRRFSAYKFRRNHPLGKCFLDFYCHEATLAIELDGGGHRQPKKQQHDEERTHYLEAQGIKVLRFWNSQLLRNRRGIRDTIFLNLQARAPHALPNYTQPLTPTEKSQNPKVIKARHPANHSK